MNPNSRFETVSHSCCTIANLATNSFFFFFFLPERKTINNPFPGESQTHLIENPKLFVALKHALEKHNDMEIKRHVARGIANFALYGSYFLFPI